MKTFWRDLVERKKPFFVLAPMEDVTDTVFRRLIASVGRPDVFFTEFTSVEGMLSKGALQVGRRLEYTEEERPLIAQIWGLQPENFYKATKLLVEQGFDGIDLNMGCPSKEVTSKGACSALIKNPSLAKEIIQATKEGIRDSCRHAHEDSLSSRRLKEGEISTAARDFSPAKPDRNDSVCKHCIPLSVKTRIGYSKIQTEEWCRFLLEQGIEALIVHGRTVKEMSKVPAHWDEIAKVVALRDAMNVKTVIIGNGDVKSLVDGKEKAHLSGVDGIMVGRGVFENAWVFREDIDPTSISIKERVDLLLRHVALYEEKEGARLAFQTLKKYFKIYIRDFDGASDLRMKLMETKAPAEVRALLADILQ